MEGGTEGRKGEGRGGGKEEGKGRRERGGKGRTDGRPDGRTDGRERGRENPSRPCRSLAGAPAANPSKSLPRLNRISLRLGPSRRLGRQFESATQTPPLDSDPTRSRGSNGCAGGPTG